jgi:hypothetical protein
MATKKKAEQQVDATAEVREKNVAAPKRRGEGGRIDGIVEHMKGVHKLDDPWSAYDAGQRSCGICGEKLA